MARNLLGAALGFTALCCLVAPAAQADDNSSDGQGYKVVKIRGSNGRSGQVRVQEAADPLKNIHEGDASATYNPERIFSSTSSMADKTFSPSSATLSKSDTQSERTPAFSTKTYNTTDAAGNLSAPNLNNKAFVSATSAYSHKVNGLDRGFAVASSDLQEKAAVLSASTTSPDQGRTAEVGSRKTDIFADKIANKQYLGPGAQHVPDGVEIKENIVFSRMSNLPDRPLTIDEVRELINHGTAPNADVKSGDTPSKPLNDPDFQPKPLRESPNSGADEAPAQAPAAGGGDDANDPVPPPGTMASPPAPESAEPLPQR